jgi:hypothetical protein
MVADAFIQFRVTPEVKTVLRALAERDQVTESEIVRKLVETMLRVQVKEGAPKVEEMGRISRDSRVPVRLSLDDRKLLMQRATGRGMASATYVAVLVRAHLHNVAPIPKAELLALNGTIAELRMFGRTLNQRARLLNQDARAVVPGRVEVQTMRKMADKLIDGFKALLRANHKSWVDGGGRGAETTH